MYIKTNIYFKTAYTEKIISIEIQKYASNTSNMSGFDLYDIWLELREKGIIWTDVKFDNLLKYNNILVIVDTDDIYNQDDKNIFWGNDEAKLYEGIYKGRMLKWIL